MFDTGTTERLAYIRERLQADTDKYVFGPPGHAFYKVNGNLHDLQPSDHRQDVDTLKDYMEHLRFVLDCLDKTNTKGLFDQTLSASSAWLSTEPCPITREQIIANCEAVCKEIESNAKEWLKSSNQNPRSIEVDIKSAVKDELARRAQNIDFAEKVRALDNASLADPIGNETYQIFNKIGIIHTEITPFDSWDYLLNRIQSDSMPKMQISINPAAVKLEVWTQKTVGDTIVHEKLDPQPKPIVYPKLYRVWDRISNKYVKSELCRLTPDGQLWISDELGPGCWIDYDPWNNVNVPESFARYKVEKAAYYESSTLTHEQVAKAIAASARAIDESEEPKASYLYRKQD